jgi:hypothetical protein
MAVDGFPYLTKSEFGDACSGLVELFHKSGHAQRTWQSVDVTANEDTKFLKITTLLPNERIHIENATTETEEDAILEDDEVGSVISTIFTTKTILG